MAQKPRLLKVWNAVDEFGLINGLGHWSEDGKKLEYVRYPNETNKQLKRRLKLARKDMGNSTVQGMVNNISRDLGVSVSGVNLLPQYNVETKSIYYLSEEPYPSASGIKVYVSSSGTFTEANNITDQQVRASGYSDATEGWIVWNQPDYDPSKLTSGTLGSSGWYTAHNVDGSAGLFDPTVRYGEYTQVLEFIGDTIPYTDHRVKVEYEVQTGSNELGQTILNTRSDFSDINNVDDERFVGKRSEIPDNASYLPWASGHVNILELSNIKEGPLSGTFYNSNGSATTELISLKEDVFKEYEMRWGKFRFDEGRWDMLDNASVGNIPSFHDSSLDNVSGKIEYTGGSKYGIDLNMVGIEVSASGIRAPWYPKFQPGEFYIEEKRYNLFAKMRSEYITMSHLGDNIYRGTITSTGVAAPYEFDTILAMHSGVFAADNNPYILRVYEPSSPTLGIMHRTPYFSKGGDLDYTKLDYDNGYGFYYDYDTGNVYASGTNVSELAIIWEDSSVETSGLYCIYSGGYSYDGNVFNTIDLNPVNDPYDKVYYIK